MNTEELKVQYQSKKDSLKKTPGFRENLNDNQKTKIIAIIAEKTLD